MLFWRIMPTLLWISGSCCFLSFAEVEMAEFSISGIIRPPPELEACHIELVNPKVDLGEIESGCATPLKGEVIVKISCNTPRMVGFSIQDAYATFTSESEEDKKGFILNEKKNGVGLSVGYYSVKPKECHQLIASGEGRVAYLSDQAGTLAERNPALQPGQLYFPMQTDGTMVPSRGFFGILEITARLNKSAIGAVYGSATLSLDYY